MVPDGLTINPGNISPVTASPNHSEKKVLESNPPPEPVVKNANERVQQESENREVNSGDLKKLVEDLNEDFKLFNASVSFSIDDDTNKTVIKISNRETEEVIREFPPEELLNLASRLTEVIGRFVDETV